MQGRKFKNAVFERFPDPLPNRDARPSRHRGRCLGSGARVVAVAGAVSGIRSPAMR
jgi:hypothetical protein